MIDTEKLEKLADWFDKRETETGTISHDVQNDLRRIAARLRERDEARAESDRLKIDLKAALAREAALVEALRGMESWAHAAAELSPEMFRSGYETGFCPVKARELIAKAEQGKLVGAEARKGAER